MSCRKPLILLVCVNLVTPQLHADQRSSTRTTPWAFVDVTLSPAGGLCGRFVDTQGQGIAGANVRLTRGDDTVGSITTNENGAYRFPTATTGIYQISIDGQSQMVRAWAHDIRPPAASAQLTMVRDDTVIRGQGGSSSFGAMVGAATLGVAAVAFGVGVAVAESQADDRKPVDTRDFRKVSSP